MKSISILNEKKQLLGSISLDQEGKIKVSSDNKEYQAQIEELMRNIIKKGIKILRTRIDPPSTDKKIVFSHTLELQEVFPKDGNLYLRGLKENLEARGLKVILR